jgi:hypothetical protein
VTDHVKIVCHWSTLMQLAKRQADAERSGDADAYAEAKRAHEDYRAACLRADEVRP